MSSRGLFIAGFIGMLLLVLIVPTTLFMRFAPFYVAIYFTIMLVVLLAGIILGSFAFLGFNRNYGSVMGLAAFLVSLILPWFSLAADYLHGYSGLAFTFLPYPTPGPLFHVWLFMWIAGDIFIGVIFLLWGISFITVRKSTGNSKLAIAVGILFIVGGGFWCTFFWRVFGDIFLVPGAILGLISLITADAGS